MSNSPASFGAVDDVYEETARILVLGESYCQGLPWAVLDLDEKSEWLPRGRRFRSFMEERGMIVSAKDGR